MDHLSIPKVTAVALIALLGLLATAAALHSSRGDTKTNSSYHDTPSLKTTLKEESGSSASSSLSKAGQSASNSSQTDISVTVNGQTVPVPPNGSVHKEIASPDGTTSVDVKTSTDSSQSATVQTDIHSQSVTSQEGDSP